MSAKQTEGLCIRKYLMPEEFKLNFAWDRNLQATLMIHLHGNILMRWHKPNEAQKLCICALEESMATWGKGTRIISISQYKAEIWSAFFHKNIYLFN